MSNLNDSIRNVLQQQPAAPSQREIQARFQAIVNQRDQAQGEVVMLSGRVAELEATSNDALKLASEVPILKARITELSDTVQRLSAVPVDSRLLATGVPPYPVEGNDTLQIA